MLIDLSGACHELVTIARFWYQLPTIGLLLGKVGNKLVIVGNQDGDWVLGI